MAGLDPAIQAPPVLRWMAGSSPAMTRGAPVPVKLTHTQMQATSPGPSAPMLIQIESAPPAAVVAA
jgi:hypothetical protein